jgi:hypothetical protein
MKTLFTLLLATVFSSAFASNEGRLTLTITSNKNVQVYVDGRAYHDNDNSFVFDNMQPGNHTIKIYRTVKNNNGRYNRSNNGNELLYSSTIYVRPSYDVDVMINRFGKALVDERSLLDRNGRWDDDRNNDGYPDKGNDNGSYGNDYRQAMSSYDFEQLVSRIKNQWFSSGKLNTARDGVSKNSFNTSQLRQILQIFSSDNDKLELAKLAYRQTVDSRNYYTLYDVLSFQNGRDELDRYIKDNRYQDLKR